MPKSRVIDRDLGWKGILASATQLARGATVRVGILGDNERGGLHQPDPTTGKAEPLTVAEIAVVNEFGTEDGHIPARPAHRMTFDQRQQEIADQSAKLLAKVVIDRTITTEQALNVMGLSHAVAIKNFITSQSGELLPNAESTVLAKVPASSTGAKRQKAIDGARPLVDTGRTLNALSWSVEIGGNAQAGKLLPGSKG